MKDKSIICQCVAQVFQLAEKARCFARLVRLALLLMALSSANAQFVNVQFGGDGSPYIKKGAEIVGMSPNDYWNFISTEKGGGPFSLYGGKDFAGNSTSINIYSGGDTQTATAYHGTDNLFNGYLASGGGTDIQIYMDLPGGTYDLYLYNHSGYSTTFTLILDGNQIASDSTSSGYVFFSGITLNSSDTLTINLSSGTEPSCNGLQITSMPFCPTPSSHPTITWTGHPASGGGAQDLLRREIWSLTSTPGDFGAEIVSTANNAATGFVDMSSAPGGLGYFYAAETVDKMLQLEDPLCITCGQAFVNFWNRSSKTIVGNAPGLALHVGNSPNHKLGYSQSRQEAYVAGSITVNFVTYSKIAIVDCVNQNCTSTLDFGASVGFGYCVFADNADKLVIQSAGGSAPSFYYFNPASSTLSSSSINIGATVDGASDEIFYVPELGVVVARGGNNTYVINPATDSVVANLGGLGGTCCIGHPMGVCYNSCNGLLYVSSVHAETTEIDKFDPANGYSLVQAIDDGTGSDSHLYFDPLSNLVYRQRNAVSEIKTY